MTGIEVEPLLVFSRAWVDRPLARRKGVRVLPARMLAGYLERQPSVCRAPRSHGRSERVAVALREDREHRARARGGHRPARPGALR